VLSFPFGLRCTLAFDHELTLALTRIAEAEIERRYRRLAREARLTEPRGGAFVAIQRCGSDLRPNVHPHAQFLDGAYGTNAQGRELFFQAPAPTPAEVEAILTRIVARARALLAEREHDLEALEPSERSLAQTLATAASTRGTTSHAPDTQDDEHGTEVHLPTRRKARIDAREASRATSTRRSPSHPTTASAARPCSATSCGLRSHTTASPISPPEPTAACSSPSRGRAATAPPTSR
jgi:hypothetical protein